MKKLITTICVVAVTILAISGEASVALSTFETFNTGVSVNGQSGWTVADSWGDTMYTGGWGPNLDEQIVNDGTGNKVWRISNAYAYGAYSSQPFSPTAESVAGETGSSLWNDYGPDHTNPYSPPHYGANATTNRFYISFDFRSATGAAQPGLSITLSPSAKQSTVRMGWLNISDSGSGLDLYWFGTGSTDAPWSPDDVTLATGLSYTGTHHIEMMVTFNDGINGDLTGNDVVKLYVDDSLAATSTTWETYYYAEGEGVTEPRLQAVDSLLFRVSGTAAPATLGNGFFFDNIEVSNVPEPATICLLGLGALSLLRRKR